MNVGKIYFTRGGSTWRLDAEEEAPSGDEFERFSEALSGFYFALGAHEAPANARGDFSGERTEAVYFKDRTRLTEDFVRAVQKWLSVPRRSNWRVLVVGQKRDNNYIVIYDDCVVLAPEADSISDAIYED
jgi:hypothetical protein